MIKENLHNIKESIPAEVTLVAVSKTKPNKDLMEAYDAGQRIFGENRVQELVDKEGALPKDIKWHMIGHLQRNKVKYIAPFINLIHGVDSVRLLKEINKQGEKNERIIDVLLQFHIATEETKFGFNFEEAKDLLESPEFLVLQHINIKGIMGMATFTKDKEIVRDEFRTLNNYYLMLKSHFFKFNDNFTITSMGMSNDFQIAIEEGSTMVRIGSSIFGAR